MGYADEAANIPAVQGDATADTTAKLYDATGTSQSHAVPKEWHGKWVRIHTTGEDVHYLFCTLAGGTVDRTVAASAAGATHATLGGVFVAGTKESVRIPMPTDDTRAVHFVRQSQTAAGAECRFERG